MKWTILIFLAVAGLALLISCSNQSEPDTAEDPDSKKAYAPDDPQKYLAGARTSHGSDLLNHSTLEFDFRDYHYQMIRDDGMYQYERIFTDTSGRKIHDVLTNDAFTRTIDGEQAALTEKQKSAYSNSVNSVIYFATLPYSLNDPAVQSAYLGEVTIKDTTYHKVRVTFREEGGGKDHEDEFIYWIRKDTHFVDYLAYNYQTDGGGARFRVAYNERTIDGVRFADYKNLKPVPETMAVDSFDSLYQAGKMEQISVIETENVELNVGKDEL